MNIMLVMIAATVGDDASVNHMDLAHAPRIESGLDKEIFQNTAGADLDVARPQP